MKTRSILTAAVLLIGSSANAQTVVHYWDFESPNDVVGGLTTVMVGAADLSIHAGYGIAYTGSGQSLNSTTLGGAYLEADVHDGIAATALDFGMSDWSFSYWSFNPTDGDARGPRIFDALVNTTVGMQLGTDFLGQLDLRLEDDLGNDAVAPPPVVIQPTDSWIHVVVNVDRTNDSADFYFNNVLQGSMSLTALAGNLAPTQDLQIGVINNGNPSMGSQDGGLDDLAFYEGLLDASDRAGLANGTLTPLAFTGPSSGLCAGDGGNQMGCTDCPCGNNAPLGAGGGCINSSGSGTELQSSGDPSISLPDGAVTDLQFQSRRSSAHRDLRTHLRRQRRTARNGESLLRARLRNPLDGSRRASLRRREHTSARKPPVEHDGRDPGLLGPEPRLGRARATHGGHRRDRRLRRRADPLLPDHSPRHRRRDLPSGHGAEHLAGRRRHLHSLNSRTHTPESP